MPFSVDEFAAQIKAKFPDYASWPNDHLVSEIVTKHPEYRSWVTLDPRTEIAMRRDSPPAAAHGDPNAAEQTTVGDVLGAAGKGIAHLAGIPTSMAEVPEAVRDWALNVATMGAHGAMKTVGQLASDVSAPARAYASGQAPTAEQNAGAVPIVGRPALETARPAIAYAHGNAPTRADNLGAVESGTALAGMAAMAHPAVAGAIESGASKLGAGMEASGVRSYADALAPADAPMRPLAETIGSRLANEGKVLTDPAKQLGPAVGGTTDISVQKFAKTASADKQLEALQLKYPDAQITDAGTDFIVRRRTPERVQADALASSVPPAVTDWWKMAKAAFGPAAGGSVGGGIGFMLGGPAGATLGAEIGSGLVTAAEAPLVVKSVTQSPLWKTTSGVVKTSLGKAMQAGDFATVTTIAARILGGIGLEDAYGHDEALHNLASSLPNDPAARQQALHDHEAVYVNPDGSQVPVPFHVQKVTKDALASSPARSFAPPVVVNSAEHDSDTPENDAMLRKTSPYYIIPARFKNARSAALVMPLRVGINDTEGAREGKDFSGSYAAVDDTGNPLERPVITTSRTAGNQWTRILYHEIGHAMWPELTTQERRAFDTASARLWDEGSSDERGMTGRLQVSAGPDSKEFFPDVNGMYVANPSKLKKEWPEGYSIMRRIYGGREYVGAK